MGLSQTSTEKTHEPTTSTGVNSPVTVAHQTENNAPDESASGTPHHQNEILPVTAHAPDNDGRMNVAVEQSSRQLRAKAERSLGLENQLSNHRKAYCSACGCATCCCLNATIQAPINIAWLLSGWFCCYECPKGTVSGQSSHPAASWYGVALCCCLALCTNKNCCDLECQSVPCFPLEQACSGRGGCCAEFFAPLNATSRHIQNVYNHCHYAD